MRLLVTAGFIDRSEMALYEGLARAGVAVRIMCSHHGPDMERLAGAGISVERLAVRHRLDLAAAVRIRHRLLGGSCDALYAPTNKTLSSSLLASLGLPVRLVAYRGTVGHVRRWNPASWLVYLNPRIDAIVCVADAVRRYLAGQGVAPEKLVVINKGHDISWYRPADRAALGDFGIPADAVVAGFTGAIRPVKGIDVLLRAASLSCRELPNLHLLLVGRVQHEKALRLAGEPRLAGRVHFAGYRPDAASLAGACDIFVMPSIAREGLPRSVMEAMCQGVPPVVTDVGGLSELVEDGLSGIVVQPRDPYGLAQAISRLARDQGLRAALGRNARLRIQERFNIERTIAEMLALLDRLVPQKP